MHGDQLLTGQNCQHQHIAVFIGEFLSSYIMVISFLCIKRV